MRFKGPAAYTTDLDHSRAFYEGLLGFTFPRAISRGETPVAVACTAGLSIWLAHSASLAPRDLRGGNRENTCETEGYEEIYSRLRATSAEFPYEPRTMPWGHRGFRVCDPGGHILNIVETMSACVRRRPAEGKTLEQICATSRFTLDEVHCMVSGDVSKTEDSDSRDGGRGASSLLPYGLRHVLVCAPLLTGWCWPGHT